MEFFISNNTQNDKILCDLKKLPIELEFDITNMFIMKMISLHPVMFKEELLLITSSIKYSTFLKLTKTNKGRSQISSKLSMIYRILSHRLCQKDHFNDVFTIFFGFKPEFFVLNIIKKINLHFHFHL